MYTRLCIIQVSDFVVNVRVRWIMVSLSHTHTHTRTHTNTNTHTHTHTHMHICAQGTQRMRTDKIYSVGDYPNNINRWTGVPTTIAKHVNSL